LHRSGDFCSSYSRSTSVLDHHHGQESVPCAEICALNRLLGAVLLVRVTALPSNGRDSSPYQCSANSTEMPKLELATRTACYLPQGVSSRPLRAGHTACAVQERDYLKWMSRRSWAPHRNLLLCKDSLRKIELIRLFSTRTVISRSFYQLLRALPSDLPSATMQYH